MASIASFKTYAAGLRTEVDAALDGYTRYDDDCPQRLADAMRHSLLAPCKRLRPVLVLMAAEACGYSRVKAMPAACAVEMVHTYSLIHDDLPAMDDDDLRRGLPTCHVAFDEPTAILAGDALLAQAFEVLATGIQPADIAARCCALLAQAAGPSALVGGQADDLAAEQGLEVDGDAAHKLKHLERIHSRKTGALFRVSLKLGAVVAGGTDEQLAALHTYGCSVGMAFQITDDLLDLSGDEAAMGKRTQKDAEQGKLTFPGLLGIEESEQRAATLIEEACDAAATFGERGEALQGLARYVLERKQ